MADFLRFEPRETSLVIHCQAAVAPHEIDMADCKEQIAGILAEHQCTEVVFGLGEVQILSSRLLALMAAVQQLGVSVWVDSPSPAIVDLLKLTRYDQVLKVRQPVS
jgi:anti-anti-sigma regulatory factor